MRLVKPDININFIGRRKIGFAVSCAMIIASILSLVIKGGPDYGIDFAGGTLIQVKFERAITIEDLKSAMKSVELEKVSIQQFEDRNDEYLLRTAATEAAAKDFAKSFRRALEEAAGIDVEIRRIEMVGPQVGKDLREKALFAIFYALLFITIYISGRFEHKWVMSGITAASLMLCVYGASLMNVSIPILMVVALVAALALFWFLQLKYAMGAIVALLHDVAITVGIFSISGKEFTLPIIAALLTIIGYSLNDTIIVFDRIRENLKGKTVSHLIINKSVNETLSRTLLTSLTTLVVLVSLFVLGGGIIHDFAFAMMVGVVVGTYSSIFVASPILLAWRDR